jgi:hypothetical protein
MFRDTFMETFKVRGPSLLELRMKWDIAASRLLTPTPL